MKYFGGFGRFLFNGNLTAETEVDFFFISFGRLFHAIIVDGKNDSRKSFAFDLKFRTEAIMTNTSEFKAVVWEEVSF